MNTYIDNIMNSPTNRVWNLEGLTVRGSYFGINVEGIVVNSRVKYGAGEVQHTVDLFFPITLFGTERTTVLLNSPEVHRVEYDE